MKLMIITNEIRTAEMLSADYRGLGCEVFEGWHPLPYLDLLELASRFSAAAEGVFIATYDHVPYHQNRLGGVDELHLYDLGKAKRPETGTDRTPWAKRVVFHGQVRTQ